MEWGKGTRNHKRISLFVIITMQRYQAASAAKVLHGDICCPDDK